MLLSSKRAQPTEGEIQSARQRLKYELKE
eukprot:COSAG01_NODE_11420_length_1938_cov_7.597607_1_plen_28_part_10